MRYRPLGNTGLRVSEIGLGAEWLERHNQEEVTAVIRRCEEQGINILDCWMSNPEVRTKIGNALRGRREKWIIQGHFGSTWERGQYVRNKELSAVEPAFQDLLRRLQTDYIDLGMIHFVDTEEDFRKVFEGPLLPYVKEQKAKGVIRHIGMSTHNPKTAKLAVLSGEVEMLLFSVNPAFDLLPENDDLDAYFQAETYAEGLDGMNPERAELYKLCEQRGGADPGAVHPLRPDPPGGVQRPGRVRHAGARGRRRGIRDRHRRGARLRHRPGQGPPPRLFRPMYLLRPLRPLPGRHRHRHGEQAPGFGRHAASGPRHGESPLPGPSRHGRRLHCLPRLRGPLPLWGEGGGKNGTGQGPAGLRPPAEAL